MAIERKFVAQKIKEYEIEEFVTNNIKRVGHSHTKVQRTPLGEKITIYASRPGLLIGRKGQNIKSLTQTLKKKFGLENPQIEINEVEDVNLDAQIVAERIVNSLERFGSTRFKAIGHRVMEDVMSSGAYGIEILMSGKVPSARSRTWRFYQGYLKKCGDIAQVGVRKAYIGAKLRSGVVGVQVRIVPPDIKLPDKVELASDTEKVVEEVEGKQTKEEAQKEGEGKQETGEGEKEEKKQEESKPPEGQKKEKKEKEKPTHQEKESKEEKK